jgi:hypothetical protein
VKVRTTILSTNLPNLSNGFGNIKAKLSGPSAGLYMTYFDGGFSSDFLLKNDFLDLDETTNQLLAFTANVNDAGVRAAHCSNVVDAGSR